MFFYWINFQKNQPLKSGKGFFSSVVPDRQLLCTKLCFIFQTSQTLSIDYESSTRQRFTTVAIYKGTLVAVKKINKKNVELSKSVLMELKQVIYHILFILCLQAYIFMCMLTIDWLWQPQGALWRLQGRGIYKNAKCCDKSELLCFHTKNILQKVNR